MTVNPDHAWPPAKFDGEGDLAVDPKERGETTHDPSGNPMPDEPSSSERAAQKARESSGKKSGKSGKSGKD